MQGKQSTISISTVIETMRFPLIVLVVFAHMLPFDTPRVHWSVDGGNVYTFVTELISHNLGRISVRCYFFIGGYFMLRKMTNNPIGGFRLSLPKKIRTLLVPYVVWNLLLVAAVLVKCYVTGRGEGLCEEGAYIREQSIWQLFWAEPANFPLWYMRDLMCMTLLAPAFYYGVRFARAWGMIVLVALYLLGIESGLPGLSTTALTFFGLGAFFALRNHDPLLWPSWSKRLIVLSASALLLSSTMLSGTDYHENVFRGFALIGVFAVLFVFQRIAEHEKSRRLLVQLAPSSFFIYVTHEIYIINWLKGAWWRTMGQEPGWWKLAGYFLFATACLAICLLLFLLLRKIMPKVLGLLTGGRLYPYPVAERLNQRAAIGAPAILNSANVLGDEKMKHDAKDRL